jgi:hypothetical protein
LLVHETFCTLSRDGHFWPLLRVHERYETHIFYNTSATEDPSWLKPSEQHDPTEPNQHSETEHEQREHPQSIHYPMFCVPTLDGYGFVLLH